MKEANENFSADAPAAGSALLLTVVLTSLLAIVGVLFVMLARIEKISTSAVSENKELGYAVQTVVTNISEELVRDVIDINVLGGDFYDYPDANNTWLASLEPYKSVDDYYWRHISDIYYKPDVNEWNFRAEIIPDYQEPSVMAEGLPADADGDGVADSCWITVPDITSSKGEPIYAAIRIIDNAGMLNVNTAYKFDPNDPLRMIDGSSQLQINLAALSQRGANDTLSQAANKLQAMRCGTEPTDLSLYEQNVAWRYGEPNGAYTTFDIGDELELRYRFLLNYIDIDTRIEEVWDNVFQVGKYVPLKSDIPDWFARAQYDLSEPNKYSYRHIATNYNMDRIINPKGPTRNNGKMMNINKISDKEVLRDMIRDALLDAEPEFDSIAANDLARQIIANLIDYQDSDSDVTYFGASGRPTLYGFESPCIYISELVYHSVTTVSPPTKYESYAIELYKPYFEDDDPCEALNDYFSIAIDEGEETRIDWKGSRRFQVVTFEDPAAPLPISWRDPDEPVDTTAFGYNRSDYANPEAQPATNLIRFSSGSKIYLQRHHPLGADLIVDSFTVPDTLIVDSNDPSTANSIQRDISLHKCIRRLWDMTGRPSTLGWRNDYVSSDQIMIQAHPANKRFTNVGEIGMVFRKASSYNKNENPVTLGIIGYGSGADTEEEVRVNLADPLFQKLFNYLTVFDPSSDGINNDGDQTINIIDKTIIDIIDETNPLLTPEFKIPGRININTAPWFVIRQLPWMDSTIAQAIVNYRDTIGGYKSIGELMQVREMGFYSYDLFDLDRFPDLTPSDGDGARWNFEERDVIFARISNLITVRSDVFTAYILVRLGKDGPQRRVIAILDRSNVYPDTAGGTIGEVKIAALHQVPDPR